MSTTTTSCVRLRQHGLTIFVTADGETFPEGPVVTPEMVQRAVDEHDALLDWLSGDDLVDGVESGSQLSAGSSQDRLARSQIPRSGFLPPPGGVAPAGFTGGGLRGAGDGSQNSSPQLLHGLAAERTGSE